MSYINALTKEQFETNQRIKKISRGIYSQIQMEMVSVNDKISNYWDSKSDKYSLTVLISKNQEVVDEINYRLIDAGYKTSIHCDEEDNYNLKIDNYLKTNI